MPTTFQEKSLRLMFLAVLLLFGGYFAIALPHATIDVSPPHIVLFTVVVVLLVAVAVAGHVVMVVLRRPEEADERHRLIELRGQAGASYVLGVGVLASIFCALLVEGNFWSTHLLLGALVLAQLTEYGIQLLIYRRES